MLLRLFRTPIIFGLGAAAMYYFDPARGRARRAVLRDKTSSMTNQLGCAITTAWEDLRNRTNGLVSETVAGFKGGEPTDDVVAARVRSHLGRVAGHPAAIQTSVQGGHVTLSGPILAGDVERVVASIKSVRGVDGVTNNLEVHQSSENIPALQGGSQYERQLYAPLSPATRLLIGMGGVLFWLRGAIEGGIYGKAQRMLGCAMSACSVVALLSSPAGSGAQRSEPSPEPEKKPARGKSRRQGRNTPRAEPAST